MIAFAIVVLCLFPLITPHVWMIKEENSFIQDLRTDRYIGIIYAHIIENLYENQILWDVIKEKDSLTTLSIDAIPESWPYIIILRTEIEKNGKEGKEEEQMYYILHLNIILKPTFNSDSNKKPTEYEYVAFVERKIKLGQDQQPKNEEGPEDNE